MTSKNIVQVTDQNFEATVGGAEQLVLLDFWATWCAPCKMLRPVVEELAVEYAGRVTVAELFHCHAAHGHVGGIEQWQPIRQPIGFGQSIRQQLFASRFKPKRR